MQSDFTNIREKALTASISLLFILFIIMLPRYNDVAKVWFVILILTAFGYLVFNLREIKSTTGAERAFLGAVIANFLWIAFTYYINGEPGRGSSFLWGRHFYLLFAIPLFFLFRKVTVSDRVIILALFSSILFSLTDIVIDLSQNIDYRLQGMNPNSFGPIQLCLSGILFFYFIKNPGHWLRWLTLVGFLLGIATVVFSKSRNTWMTLVVLSVFFAFYLAGSQSLCKRAGMAIGITLLLASAYFLPIVENRVDQTIQSLSSYIESDDYRDQARTTSLGVRIELWKTAWKIFLENPVLGVGVGGFKVEARKNSERYQVNQAIHIFKYVHNQYLAALSTRGFPGLILFLLVMVLPIYIAMSRKSHERDSHVAQLAVILICMNYLIGCLAEDHFEAKSATMFFGMMLPFMLARISAGSASTPILHNE
ncbi:MAG: O-antigen ligase family protein [Gammaproteobacteria bacterium]|nr:O-antigen ligase family protein [Gammaproteobacteria bacterium]